MVKNLIELLAPAGNFDALKAAVNAGANAVYLAGNTFGARAFAKNFDDQSLESAVRFAHLYKVAIHVTVNTIVVDSEIEHLAKYLQYLYEIGIDAILVQDLGAFSIAREIVPKLPIHASTQMTIHNLSGVKFLEKLGFNRVVLSRELTIEEISEICRESKIEIEIFAHGALCVCYSGQCLMSSLIGGRSGNRGKCAQPCRLPYKLIDSHGRDVLENRAGEYLLSPRDLNTLKILPQLIRAGVSSLKIEGRMKRPEYVATVVEVYRRAIDSLSNSNDEKILAQVFNRGFTTAFLETHNETRSPVKNYISDKRPNHRGISIGRVSNYDRNSKIVTIKLTDKISAGDQIEFWVKIGGRVTATLEKFDLNGNELSFELPKRVNIGDRVFKILDAELMNHAREIVELDNRLPLDLLLRAKIDQKISLICNGIEVESDFIVETAQKHPATIDSIRKQLDRLGGTNFELRNLDVDIDSNVMIPASVLNDLRRQLIEKLESTRREKISEYQIEIPKSRKKSRYVEIVAEVDSIEMEKLAIESGADSILFGGDSFRHEEIRNYSEASRIARKHDRKIYFRTPRIVRSREESMIREFFNSDCDAIYIHNLAFANLNKNFRTDFSIISANLQTLEFLKNLGVSSATLSPELSLEQIKILAQKSPIELDLIVHGRAELMISSYCPIGTFLNESEKCSMPCKKDRFFLRDRMNIDFPIVTDQFCRMHILNSKVLSMVDHASELKSLGIERLRIDCRNLDKSEIDLAVQAYKTDLQIEIDSSKITRGHFFRGGFD